MKQRNQNVYETETTSGRSDMNHWLRNALEASGRSQADLSRRLTTVLGRAIDKTAVNKMISGHRQIKGDELVEIARYLNVRPPGMGEGELIHINSQTSPNLEVMGHSETGAFRKADAPDAGPNGLGRALDVPADPRFPNARQFVLEQRGDGMAAASPPILPGSLLRCVHAGDAGLPLHDGNVVIVERRHESAAELIERSVRRVRVREGKVRLVAESPTPYDEIELELGQNVEITAIVTGMLIEMDVL